MLLPTKVASFRGSAAGSGSPEAVGDAENVGVGPPAVGLPVGSAPFGSFVAVSPQKFVVAPHVAPPTRRASVRIVAMRAPRFLRGGGAEAGGCVRVGVACSVDAGDCAHWGTGGGAAAGAAAGAGVAGAEGAVGAAGPVGPRAAGAAGAGAAEDALRAAVSCAHARNADVALGCDPIAA